MSVALFSGEIKEKQNSQLLVLKHGQKRVIVKRQRHHKLMVNSVCKHFPSILRDAVTLQTNQLDICDGHYVDITAEIWDDVIDLLHVVEVTRCEEMTSPVPLPLDARAVSSPDHRSAPSQVNKQDSSDNDEITIKVIFPSGEIQTSKIPREMRVDKLLADASQILGHCPTPVKAVRFVGGSSGGIAVMRENRSIGSYDIKDGGSISILFSGPGPAGVILPDDRNNRFKNGEDLKSLRIKKPIIYL
ncbi:hypothetical protein BDR04DRAFT_1144194 [Suillus decipiens]|nr:hypothetical protein BDR04DRAFT_1144194 [Suillus decipiens]